MDVQCFGSVVLIMFALEIDPEVDFDSRRAVYFRQMRYGLYVRCHVLVSNNAVLILLPRRSAWPFWRASWLRRYGFELSKTGTKTHIEWTQHQ